MLHDVQPKHRLLLHELLRLLTSMAQSYQEICFALRYGVIVQRKATMDYAVHVTRCSIELDKVEHFTIPILAVNEREAAHHAAHVTAARLFPPTGEVSFFQQRDDGVYLAAVGRHKFENGHGVNVGVSLSIRVERA